MAMSRSVTAMTAVVGSGVAACGSVVAVVAGVARLECECVVVARTRTRRKAEERVRLVDGEHLEAVQPHIALLDVVEQPAGRADEQPARAQLSIQRSTPSRCLSST